MTLLYTHRDFALHQTGAGHPERPARWQSITDYFQATGLTSLCTLRTFEPATDTQLTRVHPLAYVQSLERVAASGGGQVEADTVLSPESARVARLAAGAVCTAVREVLGGMAKTAFCQLRPPGHHALPTVPMGFCLYANIAIAARAALTEQGLGRVLIVDWDVHHGNGTQDVFYADEQVGFLSIHRWPFYPGTGNYDETGTGPGLGSTVNIPLPLGTPRPQFIQRFRLGLEKLAAQLKPELILISAGFDAHRLDPVGSLGLEAVDYAELTRAVLDVAAIHCGGRVVSVLEGGYHLEALAESAAVHVRELVAWDEKQRDKLT